jgi:hypothetical protein
MSAPVPLGSSMRLLPRKLAKKSREIEIAA